MNFSTWIDTFLSEKRISPDTVLEAEGLSGLNFMPVSVLVTAMKNATDSDKAHIKAALVRLDFANAPIKPFLQHIAGAIAI